MATPNNTGLNSINDAITNFSNTAFTKPISTSAPAASPLNYTPNTPNIPANPYSLNIAKPTAVVSSNTAKSTIQNKITPTLTQIQQDKATADAKVAADAAAKAAADAAKTSQTPPVVPSPITKTIDDHIADQTLHPGQQQYYNTVTGQQEWVSPNANGGVPQGYSTQDPKSRTDYTAVQTVEPDGSSIEYRKFSDGTYGRFNLQTGTYSSTGEAAFQTATNAANATKEIANLKNGIYSPEQQSQIDGIARGWQAAIDKQGILNRNTEGITAGNAALGGLTGTDAAAGRMSYIVKDGIDQINSLKTQRDSAIAKLKQSFIDGDISVMKASYDQLNLASAGIQKHIDELQSAIKKQKDKDDARFDAYTYQQSNKYPDAGIDGTEKSIQEVNDKVTKSQGYKSKQIVVDTTPVTGNKPNAEVADVPSSVTGLTPNALWQYSNDYALSGKSIQSYIGGLSSAAQSTNAKEAIRNKTAALATKAGVDLPLLRTQYNALGTAQREQVSFLNKTDRALTAAEQAAALTNNLFQNKGIDPYDSTWVNKTINDLTKKFGSSGDIRAYQAAMIEVGNEYAQVFARGGGRSVEGTRLAQDVIDGNVKLQDIQKTINTLKEIGKTVVSSSIDQIAKINEGQGTSEVQKYLNYIHNAPSDTTDNAVGSSTSGGSNSTGSGGYATEWLN